MNVIVIKDFKLKDKKFEVDQKFGCTPELGRKLIKENKVKEDKSKSDSEKFLVKKHKEQD